MIILFMLDNLKNKIDEALSSEGNKIEKKRLEIEENDIMNFVRDRDKEFQDELSERTEESMEELREGRDKLKEKIEKLKEAEVNPEAAPRLKKAARTNKKELIERLGNFYNKSGVPEETDFEEMKGLTDEFMEQLKETSESTNRNFMFVGKLLKEEGRELKSSLTDIEDIARDYQEFLEENSGKFTFGKKVKNYVNEMNALEDKIDGLNEDPIKDKIEDQKDTINNIEGELRELKNGDLKERVEELEGKVEELKEKRKKVETQIFNELSDIRKAFKKYQYETNLEGMEETFLEMYINSPLKALNKDESNSYLKGFLKGVDKFISRNGLNLDDKRSRKINEQISEIRDGFLDDKMQERNEITRQVEDVKGELDSLDFERKLDEKRKELEGAKERLDEFKGNHGDLREERKNAKRRINNIKNDLENLMEKVLKRDVEIY